MNKEKILFTLFTTLFIVMICLALIVDGWQKSFSGFIFLQLQPARLINDFFALAGFGATLLNAVAVGIIGFTLIRLFKITLSGPTFAALFTIIGFGLFGKTVLNILPILIGVYIAAKVANKSFQEYAIIALFATAIGPLVSFFVAELGMVSYVGILVGSTVGIIAGFFLPAIAISMLNLHQGYNLYNTGLTTGFLGLFFASIIKTTGHEFTPQTNWFDESSLVMILLVPTISLVLIIIGSIFGKLAAWKSFIKIQRHSGRLPSDFMMMESIEGALINAGFVGLIGSGYVLVIGGDFNGPVIGGLLTIIGFGAFGTHLKNAWPVLLGVIVSTLIFGKSLSAPGPILAAIFGTTLSPLAGQFGIITGFIAGFLHLIMVLQTGSWHGGMSLYNNGFAGGLTATLIVAVIQWYKNSKTGFRS